MIKVYAGIGIILGVAASGFWAGYQIASGKAAKQENKIIIEQVENHNEDIISLEAHTAKVNALENEYKERLARIPSVPIDTHCPIDDFKRVWDEATAIANSVHIEDGD